MTWVLFLVVITLVDNYLWVPVSYPVLKDEAYSVQLGLFASSIICWFGRLTSPLSHTFYYPAGYVYACILQRGTSSEISNPV